MVLALALVLGLITVVDQPNRQAFLYDMVGPEDLRNAVGLQMAIGSTSRAIGPAVAGVLIGVAGIGPCFLFNAASFAAVIISLLLMRPEELHPVERQPRAKRQFREGLAYVGRTPELLGMLVFTAVFFGVGWDFEVILPLVAKFTFHGGAGLFGVLISAIGVGAVMGGLASAAAQSGSNRLIVGSGLGVSLLFVGAAIAPVLVVELPVLLILGFFMLVLSAVSNVRLQLHTDPAMRGRVMALWTVAAVGTRPLGGPLLGFVGQHLGPRWGLAVAGILVLIALGLWFVITQLPVRRAVRTGAAAGTMVTEGDDTSVLAAYSVPVGTETRTSTG
jgi:MFS family permease